MKKPIVFLAFSGLTFVLTIVDGQAIGFRLPNQDPEGIARGNAFTATADNPSAIYYNPAGISQLEGQQLSLGSYFISTGVDYRGANGARASTVEDFQAVPQIYYVYSPGSSPLSYGVGIYAPYGLGIEYHDDSSFQTLAQNGKVLYACLNPVVSYRISPELSMAAGLTLNYSEVSLERQITGPSDRFTYDGNGFAAGFNLGLLWQPIEMWSFGLNFRSSTDVNYEGKSQAYPYSGKLSTDASITYPAFVVGGISFRPNDDWNIEFDLDWTNWDSVNDTKFKGTFGGDQTFPFRYKSGFTYDFGVTRQLGCGYYASVGYIYSENNVPDTTFSPLNPDANLQLGSIGFGHRGEKFSWAMGYHFAYNGGRTVKGSAPSLVGETADGEYTTFNQAVNFSIGYRF